MRLVPLFAVLVLAACGTAGKENPGDNCKAAGGTCVLGPADPVACPGGSETLDCNCTPVCNPGGGHCCLPCPSGKAPADGGGCQ